MSILEKAIQLAYVKGGIEEGVKLADQLESTDEKITAVIYKVAEQKRVTFNELRGMHFPENIVSAAELLLSDETLFDNYIERLSFNPLARAVKKAEISLSLDSEDGLRLEKLKEALNLLS